MWGWLGLFAAAITYDAWAITRGHQTLTDAARNHPVPFAFGIAAFVHHLWLERPSVQRKLL